MVRTEDNKKEYNKWRNDRLHKANNAIFEGLLSAGCLDCGNTDGRVLTFDHVPERGHKEFSVRPASAKKYSTGKLLRELAKCDVVCANCHAIRTYERKQKER